MSTDAQTHERLDLVDAQRGLAVVLMIWMHTADAWLEPSLKHGRGWDAVRSIGGLAAPTFLLLVGLSLALGWERRRTAAGVSGWSRGELARGLQLIVLGYGLRLQLWVVDAGGFRQPGGLIGSLLLVTAYVAWYRGLGHWSARAACARELLVGTAAFALAWSSVLARQPPPTSLLRVDVLQAIGASIAVLALLRGPLSRQPVLGPLFGIAVGLATPWFKSWVPGPLPVPVASYLAQWPPGPNQRIASLFPLFPWLSYPLIGSAVGCYLARAASRRTVSRAVLRLTLLGLLFALIACEPLPLAGGLLRSHPGLADLSRVVYRVGIALLLGGLGFALVRTIARAPLVLLGRTSLFVYWVHLQLAFGAVASPIAHELGFQSWLFGFGVLVVVMTVLASVWSRLRGGGPDPRTNAPESSTPGFSGA